MRNDQDRALCHFLDKPWNRYEDLLLPTGPAQAIYRGADPAGFRGEQVSSSEAAAVEVADIRQIYCSSESRRTLWWIKICKKRYKLGLTLRKHQNNVESAEVWRGRDRELGNAGIHSGVPLPVLPATKEEQIACVTLEQHLATRYSPERVAARVAIEIEEAERLRVMRNQPIIDPAKADPTVLSRAVNAEVARIQSEMDELRAKRTA